MLTKNALAILERRYLEKDEKGNVVETPEQMFRRVAKTVAEAEERFGASQEQVEETENRFYNIMHNLEFLPNSPTLANAGRRLGQLAACFVLPIEDSLASIFEILKSSALIWQSGGGTGFSFSKLRPASDLVRSTSGISSGPLSFMEIFNAATEVVKQGSIRRGANMGILRVDHPDILDFITAKRERTKITNFNMSVAVTDQFMQAVKEDAEYELINPRDNQVVRKLRARDVFRLIVESAWDSGEPGMIFLDTINRANPTPQLGPLESTNPCGEQPLLPYESCTLGSINMSKMVTEGGGSRLINQGATPAVDYEKLRKMVFSCVRFLDNVVEVNRYPLPQIEELSRGNRKIGLGIMGFADMLIKMGIPYDSEEAIRLGGEVMHFIDEEAHKASAQLADERGVFPHFPSSTWAASWPRMRNATVTTVAPTGTISAIAGCSSGIEPLFAIAYVRRIMGTELVEVNPLFEEVARSRGFYSAELMRKIGEKGRVKSLHGVPADVQRLFVTAHDVHPEWHVRMQAEFQKYVDNAVSKTINLPHDAKVEDVEKAYLLAYRLGCKGVTVYRDSSRPLQPLAVLPRRVIQEEEVLVQPPTEPATISITRITSEVPGEPARVAISSQCPECGETKLRKESAAVSCPQCGYSEVAEIT
ncbi:MAG: vitamin B12-dependent ribonucleotide reductase [Chloroflexi bacterium]|nr:vitamin B12-dependent ribonucleotide reductase [Chloroflexota bacterium]